MTSILDLKHRSVLVTGAAGCIGAWVVKILSEIGAKPVVYDLTENHQRLKLIMHDTGSVIWELGDVTNFERLSEVAEKHNVEAIIHLAALQVPFCKADPVTSTQVNVIGSVNILQLARLRSITRLSYASSIAAPAMGDNDSLATLYGAHKVCGEQMAAVYWQDWQVPSVGVRPTIVYGPGRDQGMSAAPTIAMLAAQLDIEYEIPFSGLVSYLHAEDAAQRFIVAAAQAHPGAPVFDLNGTVADTPDVLEMIREHRPNAKLNYTGDPMPFPADASDNMLEDFLGLPPCRSMRQGVSDTLKYFESAQARGFDLAAMASKIIGTQV
jgi:nucleoside-diphosphate-sugar epimerase